MPTAAMLQKTTKALQSVASTRGKTEQRETAINATAAVLQRENKHCRALLESQA